MNLYDVTGCRAEYIKPETNLSVWAAQNRPFAVCNGSLYDGGIQFYRRPAGPPVGTVLEEGRLVRQEGNYPGVGIRLGKLDFGGPWENAWDYFLAGYNCPVLRAEYNPPAWNDSYVFGSRNIRIGIGYTTAKKTVIVTDENATLEQFARHAINKGVCTLVNLDGGGSRHLHYNGQPIYTSPRIPYNALAFYREGKEQATCPYKEPTRYVRWGTIGDDARWVQWMLTYHGFTCTVDGLFFNQSVAILKEYQSKKGLVPDGCAGPLTYDKLAGRTK